MKKLSLFSCLITFLLFVGCGGGGSGGDDSPQMLTVSQESPLVDAVNVPAKSMISAVFSQTMARETLNALSFLVDSPGGPISGSVVCTGSTVSFLPDAPLKYNTVYTATITTEAESLEGSTLVSEHSWSFTTVEAGPGDPDNYIPFTQKRSWTYKGTLTEEGNPLVNYTNTSSINGTTVVDGKIATIFIESNPDNLGEMDAYLYKDLDGITDYGGSFSVPLSQQIIPYQEINFPTSVGDSYVNLHKAGLDYGFDEDGDGVNESFDILSRLTFVSLETVIVPAGTYVNCAQIKVEVLITITFSRDNSSYTSQSTDHYWYAPGVGRIKYTSVFEYADGSTDTVEELLTSLTYTEYLLASDLQTGASTIAVAKIHSMNGELTSVAGSPFIDGPYPYSMAAEPLGRFVYVADFSDNLISAYALDDEGGMLSEITGSPFSASGNPVMIASVQNGKYIYTANQGSADVSGFAINPATGALTELPGSPYPSGLAPVALVIDPAGKFVYVANSASSSISGFSINAATGDLTPVPGSPFAADVYPRNFAIDPLGKFLYVGIATSFAGESTEVMAFSIGLDGTLTPVPGAPFTAGRNPIGLVVDKSGKFLYVCNAGEATLSAFAIEPSGALSLITDTPYPLSGLAWAITFDSTGRFLYVGGVGVDGFAFDSQTGALSTLTGSPFALGTNVVSVLAIQPQ